EHIGAVSAEQDVVAAAGEQDVETGPAEQDVVARAAEQDVVAAATVGQELHSNWLQACGLDDIVAAESVHAEPVAGGVGPGDAHLGGEPGYCDHAAGGCCLDRVGPGGAVPAHRVRVPAGYGEVEQADIDQVHVRARQVIDNHPVRPAEGEE